MSRNYFIPLIGFLLFLVPSSAFAATNDQLQSQNGHFYTDMPVQLAQSQYLDQSEGRLRVTFMQRIHFLDTSHFATSSPFSQTGGQFLLSYSACTSTFCANPSYPTMPTELWPGQSTIYLNYKITLDSLNGDAVITVREAH